MPNRMPGRPPDHRSTDRDLANVLLVDDRQDNLLALEAILQGLPVKPVGVCSGEQALKQLLLEEYALILLDAHMPGMDGFETADHIKRRERTRGVPIIFFTAADRDAHLALRGYAAGAVDYLTKPFDPWILRAKVSILVDLWRKTRQLRAQAALTESRDSTLRTVGVGLDEATELLRSALVAENGLTRDRVEKAVEVLQRARRQLD